ncbi:predicted protein [Coccidioides posadasii str. Silveira]|uniref:Predicted protein n=1 Tax=Coccidioides posadasii (strain RMSCC 757 / Silveira) TaxID=443226 RepID=E9D134_COCPS|nr:predicted protein [Coccidioides posadasii str. Silveira]
MGLPFPPCILQEVHVELRAGNTNGPKFHLRYELPNTGPGSRIPEVVYDLIKLPWYINIVAGRRRPQLDDPTIAIRIKGKDVESLRDIKGVFSGNLWHFPST